MNGIDKLIQLVPPPELCKKIPPTEFADSALVWYRATITGDMIVLPRLYKGVDAARTVAPAPTLEEIVREVRNISLWPDGVLWQATVKPTPEDFVVTTAENMAAAALRLWLQLEGLI